MAVKTITITEDAYEALKRLKNEGESFSEVIVRVAKGKENIEKYFGILDKGGAERMKRYTKEFKRKFSKDYEERKHAVSRQLSGN